nr:hypothetical protein [Tanacetum cinerariifolium]
MESKDTLSSCSNSKAQKMQQIQDTAKKSCMVSFQQLHSHLKRLSQSDLQGSRTESVFKCAFGTLSGQDTETFTGTMFLNVEQLEKQLDNEDFQEIGSIAAFNAIPEFRDTLIQHLEYVKKLIDERVQMTREYDSWVNERQMQTTEEKVDTSKALGAISVDTESSKTESKEQDTSSRSRNHAHDDDVDVRPIYDEEPMAEKCVFSANHDSCVTKFLKDVNARAKVPSNKTTTRRKPVEQISVAKKLERHIPKGHRWKPTGKIFKTVSLRWVPTGRILTSSTTKVDCEPPNSSNADITNQNECEQTRDVSAVKMEILLEPTANKLLVDIYARRSYALSWIPCQGDSLNLSDHSLILAKSDSSPHAYAQTTKIYKASRLKNQESSNTKTKTSTNSDKQDLPQDYKSIKGDC